MPAIRGPTSGRLAPRCAACENQPKALISCCHLRRRPPRMVWLGQTRSPKRWRMRTGSMPCGRSLRHEACRLLAAVKDAAFAWKEDPVHVDQGSSSRLGRGRLKLEHGCSTSAHTRGLTNGGIVKDADHPCPTPPTEALGRRSNSIAARVRVRRWGTGLISAPNEGLQTHPSYAGSSGILQPWERKTQCSPGTARA